MDLIPLEYSLVKCYNSISVRLRIRLCGGTAQSKPIQVRLTTVRTMVKLQRT